jgi:dTDP-4-amino-4,6-dideoxygalactose transaminase
LFGSELVAAFRPAAAGDIDAFEQCFAAVAGQRHAVAFPYGRTGLLCLLKALGISGKQVICPAYTCVVVPNAIVTSGNRPDFIDSMADANGDLGEAAAIASPQTGALVATSIFGNPVDLDALARFRTQHPGIPIIQDCAHSFLCEWNGRPVHREGCAAVFGLNISKTMSSVFGGMVTTDDDDLAERVRRVRTDMVQAPPPVKTLQRIAYMLAVYPAFFPPLFGVTERLRQTGLLDRFTRYYREDRIDMPADYRIGLTRLEARVGTVQCGRLYDQIAARRRFATFYRDALADVPGLEFIPAVAGSSYSHIAARVVDRKQVLRAALKQGVQLGEVIEYSIPEMAAYHPHRREGARWPVAAMLAQQSINLPLSGRFDHRLAGTAAAIVRSVLKNAKAPPRLPLGPRA